MEKIFKLLCILLTLTSLVACKKKQTVEVGDTNTMEKPMSLDYDINEIFNWSVVSDKFDEAKDEAYNLYDEAKEYNLQQVKDLCLKMFPLMCSFYENGRSIYTVDDACELYKDALLLTFISDGIDQNYKDIGIFTRDAIVALYGGYDDTEFMPLTALQDAIFKIEDLGIATYQPSQN